MPIAEEPQNKLGSVVHRRDLFTRSLGFNNHKTIGFNNHKNPSILLLLRFP